MQCDVLLTKRQRYHYLNHYAIYSGGYREDVIVSVKKLLTKYEDEESILLGLNNDS